MIVNINNVFFLQTADTSYIFRIMKTGQLEHLYYGSKIKETEHVAAMFEKQSCQAGNMISYNKDNLNLNLENVCLEMSSYGKGDVREPFITITYENGSSTSDFVFDKYEISDGKTNMETLPSSYGDESEVTELKIWLKEKSYNVSLELIFDVYAAENVITRRAVLINESEEALRISRIMSSQIDFPDNNYDFIHFSGAWAREMNMARHEVNCGKIVNSSLTGTSSNRANPFTMLCRKDATENAGECYGFNLVYSGNHYTAVDSSCMGKLRVVTGINPECFLYTLGRKEKFESPEAVMTYSSCGFRKLSHNMHNFVRNHIVRGVWQKKERPILLNSWEAAYFDINESKLLKMAKAGKEVGIELFVVDDGWFGNRKDDTSSLGDWVADKKKLPGGVKQIADKIHALDMKFGIWVEPEMVNADSNCFRKHPEWVIRIPDRNHSEGRNQMLLDLTKDEVCRYVIASMRRLFNSAKIDYVKWDMNRIFSDVYSEHLGQNRQGEVYHRYVLGLYKIMENLTREYPDILFEGCASGGNRFDLGILCYMPQIWASDNTDAYCRTKIQTGLSYGYPLSTFGAHVSGTPNHQTLRTTSLETRFNVAAFGVLGYECNIGEMKQEEKKQIKNQIEFYKKHRKTFQFGDFYRLKSGEDDNLTKGQYQWMVVNPKTKDGIGMFIQGLGIPNVQFAAFKTCGLDSERIYHFYNRRFKYNIKEFGDLINTVAPIHVKKDSAVHNAIAKVIKMDNEKEDVMAPGDLLNNAGVKLNQAYAGTGYNEEVRLFKDFESRMYIIE